jgi:hypothetical protein
MLAAAREEGIRELLPNFHEKVLYFRELRRASVSQARDGT